MKINILKASQHSTPAETYLLNISKIYITYKKMTNQKKVHVDQTRKRPALHAGLSQNNFEQN